MFTLENEVIKIAVAAMGAELQLIYNKKTGQSYMWDALPEYWPKYSPLLFPIVGTLKNDTYFFKNKAYQLTRHGFAREMVFELYHQNNHQLTLKCSSNDDTLKKYPFSFELFVDYSLDGLSLSVGYRVVNTATEPMYFSIGGHPAFKIPLFEKDSYTDYELQFNQTETAERWLLQDGLLNEQTASILNNSNMIALHKSLFEKDAIVFKHLKSTKIRLVHHITQKGIEFDFNGFPYLGIWAAKGADFLCIEPWCGIADGINSSQQLVEKEGINRLEAGALFERVWKVSVLE